VTNITTQPPVAEIHPPTGFIEPLVDGEVTSYFEWVGAGCIEVVSTAGAMHQVAERPPGVALVEFGFDLRNLYIRVDGTRPMSELLGGGLALTVRFIKPAGQRIVSWHGRDGLEVRMQRRAGKGDWRFGECPGLLGAVGRVVELQVPFASLGAGTGDPVAFFIVLTRESAELEQHPRHLPIEFEVPDRRFAAVNWTA
jgi:hypothetical protein